MTPAPPPAEPKAAFQQRIALPPGRSLRQHAARGTIINGAFTVATSSLGLLRGFIVAAFLTRGQYGLWGVLVVSLSTLAWLANVGIGDKYIQQDEPDQELAFQKAFTLELITSMAFMAVLIAAVPLFALIYQQPALIAPGLAVTLVVPLGTLQAPVWVYYRRMQYVRQRLLQAVEPIVGFVVVVALAVAGAGYWSLVAGVLVGNAAAACAALIASPYRIALRYDRGTLRGYWHFSWPLFVMGVGGVAIAQGTTLFGNAALGLAGVGAIALAASISQYTERVDAILTSALYPAICAVKDRTELLFESFVKSNRLALMWGMPFGVGLTLFASDLVEFGLGERWRSAVIVIQVFGAAAAVHQIGFNWDAYFRARGDTRPMAVVGLISALAFFAFAVPLLFSHGLTGFAVGMAIMTVIQLIARSWYLTRLFSGLRMVRHAARAIAPTVPAVAAVLAVRLAETGPRTLGIALAELALYLAVTAVATFGFEHALLREVRDYLRRGPRRAPAVT